MWAQWGAGSSGLSSVDQLKKPKQHEAAYSSQGGKKFDKMPLGGASLCHEENLKDRYPSGLAPLLGLLSNPFAGLHICDRSALGAISEHAWPHQQGDSPHR